MTEALDEAARDHGRTLANRARTAAGENPSHAVLLHTVRQVLDEEEYHTRADPAGLTLTNCPFRALAAEHTDTICTMNLAIMKGLLDRPGQLALAPVLHPATRDYCVVWWPKTPQHVTRRPTPGNDARVNRETQNDRALPQRVGLPLQNVPCTLRRGLVSSDVAGGRPCATRTKGTAEGGSQHVVRAATGRSSV